LLDLACILLAAGRSVRMGQPKLLRRIGDKTIFEIALAHHLASSVPFVCAVVAGWLDGFKEIRGACRDRRVRFIEIAGPCQMAESLKAGWRCIRSDRSPDAIMISLADKPLVTADVINLLIESFEESRMPVCVPVYNGTQGHPVVISCDFESEILAATGDVGARKLLASHRDEIEEVSVDTDAVLLDVDSLADLAVLEARLVSDG
jgi:molybdenum cofactor cytidylyltransferase